MSKGSTKRGGGVIDGLWVGTAVFAASKAGTFGAFVKAYAMYAAIIIVVAVIAMYVLKAVMGGREKFEEFQYPPCPKVVQPSPGADQKCKTASGDVILY